MAKVTPHKPLFVERVGWMPTQTPSPKRTQPMFGIVDTQKPQLPKKVSMIRWLSLTDRGSISYSKKNIYMIFVCVCMHMCIHIIYIYIIYIYHTYMCVCVHWIILNKHCSNKWLLRNKEVPLSASPSYVAAQASDGCRSHGRDQKGRTEESRSTCSRAWARGFTLVWYTPYIYNKPSYWTNHKRGTFFTSSPISEYTYTKI